MTTPRRVPDVLARRARREPARLAHDDTARTLTFGEWDQAATAIGGGLAAAGLAPGDRVLLPITNAHAVSLAVAYIGVQRAGGICVPVNTRQPPSEVAWFADFVEATAAITDCPGLLEHAALERVWTVDAPPDDPGALPDQAALAAGDADIIATSGTTGRPKGVVTTHAELVAGLGDGTGTSPVRTILHAVPFTGYGGLHGIMLNPLRHGSAVITQPRFDPAGFLRLAADREVDAVQVVPAMLRLLLDCPDPGPLPALRWIFTGTAPLPPDTVQRCTARWPGARVVNMYGSTEAGLTGGTQISPRDARRKPGSVGKPRPGTAIEVRDSTGAALPPGEQGEVWVRLNAATRRYWKDPEATAATWQDGWLRTGDLGVIDADGDLTITGRAKDLIIRGGYNIAPVEIEDRLHEHPAVAEAAVKGVAHEVLGEDLVAYVTARPGAPIDPDALRAWLSQRLADYKVPRRIVVLDALPRNAMGKVVKAELPP